MVRESLSANSGLDRSQPGERWGRSILSRGRDMSKRKEVAKTGDN